MKRELDEKYLKWRETNNGITIFAEALLKAYKLKEKRITHFGIKSILESIRFDNTIRVGKDENGFKINNNYSSRLAREIMEVGFLPEGFFEVRRLKDET